MTSGLGVDPLLDGNGVPIKGTSAQDIRKIYGGLYSPGVISGGAVTTSASVLSFAVSAGVAAIPGATGEVILAPIPAKTVTALPAPSTGSRTDIVYVQQRYTSIEGDPDTDVFIGQTLPQRAVALGTYTINAGITNSNAAVLSGSVNYSIPYGASMGLLHEYKHNTSQNLPTSLTRWGTGQINLPTDRKLLFSIRASLQAVGAVGFDNSKYCEYYFLPNIDNADFVIWQTPGLHQSLATYQFDGHFNASAGIHTVKFGIGRMVGPGTGFTYAGTDGMGFGREGIIFQVRDAGPVT
jgi:hypothetical protein